MQRVPVVSEAVRSIGYAVGTLEIEFADGDVYRYFEVPEAVYGELMLAESIGRYVSARVRGRYRYVREAGPVRVIVRANPAHRQL